MQPNHNTPQHYLEMAVAIVAVVVIGAFGVLNNFHTHAATTLTTDEQTRVDEYLARLWLEENGDTYANELTQIDLDYVAAVQEIMSQEPTPTLDEDILAKATRSDAAEFVYALFGTTGYDAADDTTMSETGFTTDTKIITEVVGALSLNSETYSPGALLATAASYADPEFDGRTFSSEEVESMTELASNFAEEQNLPELINDVNMWLSEKSAPPSKSWWQRFIDWIKGLFKPAEAQALIAAMLPIVGQIQQSLVSYLQANPGLMSTSSGQSWTWGKPEALNEQEQALVDELEWLNERLKLNEEALAKAEKEGKKVTAAIHRRAIQLIKEKMLGVMQKLNELRRKAKAIRDAKVARDEQERKAAERASQRSRRSQSDGQKAYEEAKSKANKPPTYDEWLDKLAELLGGDDIKPRKPMPEPEPLPISPPGLGEPSIPGLDNPLIPSAPEPNENITIPPIEPEPAEPVIPTPTPLLNESLEPGLNTSN